MKLLLVGDVMLGRLVNDDLHGRPPEYPWGDTLPLFREADLRLCNLECALSGVALPRGLPPKMFRFRSDPENVAVLQAAGIDCVTLANNHVLDYGDEGLRETLRVLDRAGIARAGAGETLEEAAQPALVRVGSDTVGVVGFSDNEPLWAANRHPGILYAPVETASPEAAPVFSAVTATRQQADLVLVSPHWGPNWGTPPPLEQPPFARALVDRGADVVFGHSGHIFRGIELYRGRPLIYSAGDYIDDYAVDPRERNDWSFAFLLDWEAPSWWRLRMYPTEIRRFQVCLAPPSTALEIAGRMARRCLDLGTETRWDDAGLFLEIESPQEPLG